MQLVCQQKNFESLRSKNIACSAVEQILIPEASVEGGNHQNASKTLEIHLETSIVTLGWIQTAHRAPQPDIATVTLFG